MRKTLVALVALLAIGLAGCTTAKDNANTKNYPQEAKDNFVDTCAAEAAKKSSGGSDSERRDQCRCIVEALERTLPYDRTGGGDSFKDADTAIKDGKQEPGGVTAAREEAERGCAR